MDFYFLGVFSFLVGLAIATVFWNVILFQQYAKWYDVTKKDKEEWICTIQALIDHSISMAGRINRFERANEELTLQIKQLLRDAANRIEDKSKLYACIGTLKMTYGESEKRKQ